MSATAHQRRRRSGATNLEDQPLVDEYEREQQIITEAEAQGLDVQLYVMTKEELSAYAFKAFDLSLDKSKTHAELVRLVMDCEQAADDADEIDQIEKEFGIKIDQDDCEDEPEIGEGSEDA